MLHALPVSADVGTFTLSDRTEVRVRNPDPVTNQAAMDLDTLADVRATLASPHSLYTLAYLPRLTLVDVGVGPIAPSLLHGWLASAEWTAGQALVGVHEIGNYGTAAFQSLSALPAPGTPVPTQPGGQPTPVANTQLVPTVQTFQVVSSNTSVSSSLTLRPWLVTGIVGYQLSGGADSTSQQSLPLGQGPYVQAIADLRAGRHDHLVTTASVLESSFVPIDTEIALAQGQEQWRHAWGRHTDTMFAGGIYEARTRTAALAPYVYATGGTAEAFVEQRFGAGKNVSSIEVDVRLAPLVNQLTGLIDERIQGTLTGSWTHRKVTLRALGVAAESTDQSSPTASRLLSAEIDASYVQSPVLSFDVGARLIDQEQSFAAVSPTGQITGPITQSDFTQEVIFFAVTVHAVKTNF